MSQQRSFNFMQQPEIFKALLGLSAGYENSTLEYALLELVKLRASQINGCGFCVDMHTKDARLEGETEQRLYLTSVWREAPGLYTEREQAALAWTEAVTKLENQHVPDAVYDQARAQFSDKELAQLTLAVVAINGWNRFNIAFNAPAGSYKAGSLKAMHARAS
ncbi:alkyl hydroperoxide reductase AhpD [Steroidobacter agaridevorans]|uniref:Alkyl hydroperoxide reductase AhpD n=1 Tax=Steroidobacter agaridevorans TaxID=2695856 RepID=A0A829Y5F4_9GAMM|nr:carboxymuconolactone decarboxylase family protein [Steroidobacter agaridevorans]GFE78046.1 alkyl hydroperoxide reductase AhpD [Steroidobacter agaridevorans]GFE91105.1 alkyl hydroperoxide reductase AhpD [Steroidobacter agaridevorans]